MKCDGSFELSAVSVLPFSCARLVSALLRHLSL